jgi:hypothetical protein
VRGSAPRRPPALPSGECPPSPTDVLSERRGCCGIRSTLKLSRPGRRPAGPPPRGSQIAISPCRAPRAAGMGTFFDRGMSRDLLTSISACALFLESGFPFWLSGGGSSRRLGARPADLLGIPRMRCVPLGLNLLRPRQSGRVGRERGRQDRPRALLARVGFQIACGPVGGGHFGCRDRGVQVVLARKVDLDRQPELVGVDLGQGARGNRRDLDSRMRVDLEKPQGVVRASLDAKVQEFTVIPTLPSKLLPGA